MKKKLLWIDISALFIIVLVLIGSISEKPLTFSAESAADKELYKELLANHPFNNRNIDLTEWEEMPKQDRPDLAWEQDYLATMNPATGRPEREKLTPILQMTKAMMYG